MIKGEIDNIKLTYPRMYHLVRRLAALIQRVQVLV